MADPKIKFSHTYAKLMVPGESGPVPCAKATLIQVMSMHIDELSKAFIDYDTDFNKYKLEYNTLYLMLIFQKPDGNIFTTLRPQFGQFGNKKEYYANLVCREFEVVVNGTEHKTT